MYKNIIFILLLFIVIINSIKVVEKNKKINSKDGKIINFTPQQQDTINDNSLRAEEVKDAMKFAWENYVDLAWGYDELEPVSEKPYNWYFMGLTIVDGADTLFLMGLDEEYKAAREWISTGPDQPTNSSQYVSVFEGNIRLLGGYLSLHDLTGDDLYIEKAINFGYRILEAFDDDTLVFPNSALNFATNETSGNSWAQGCAYLANAGTFFLEFNHLWMKTGIQVFRDRSIQMLEAFTFLHQENPGLYPNMVQRSGKSFCGSQYTVAGSADSYYEYLNKMTYYTSKTNDDSYPLYQHLWKDASSALIGGLWTGPTPQGDYYFDTVLEGKRLHTMIELGCFAGGMFSLSSFGNSTQNTIISELHLEVGANLTKLCAKLFTSTPTGLAAEVTYIDPTDGSFNYTNFGGDPSYYLRPETVESLFYLYRITGDSSYQDLGWEIFLGLNTSCRTDHGFAGLDNVEIKGQYNDDQQSYFLAETLKYLYLLFSNTTIIPLSEWVFNTEGHPLFIPAPIM